MRKIWRVIPVLILLLVLLTGIGAEAEEIQEPGLPAALERADAFNEWVREHTVEEISAETHLPVSSILSPYGTDAPPEPLIEVREGEAWYTLIDRILDKYGVGYDNVGIGYYNTRTGEEIYINPDTYLISASMFKVPLNMIYADRISSGEMAWDSNIGVMPYSWYQYRTIVESDNDRSVVLMEQLGGYQAFKQLQIPYLGNDPVADLGYNYSIDNFYNPREFIHLLRMLYEDPARFPGIVEHMLVAEPYRYFRQYDHRYPTAQKYGFVSQNNTPNSPGFHTYINTCGIIYTPDPFCLVVFTDNVGQAYDLIGELARVMIDYTNMVSAREDVLDVQREQEAREQAAADRAALEEGEKQITERMAFAGGGRSFLAPVPAAQTAPEETRFSMSVGSSLMILGILVVALAALVAIFRHNTAGRINGFWAVLAILIGALGLVLCVAGLNVGTVVAKPEGDPKQTVADFFDSLIAQDYPSAYACLANYSSLGMENAPAGKDGQLLFEALKKSYGYTLLGEAEMDGLHARQRAAVLHLNLNNVRQNASTHIGPILTEIAASRPHDDVYGEDGGLLPSVGDEIYLRALQEALNGENSYLTSTELMIPLVYRDGKWLIEADSALLSALAGGV